MKDKKEEKIIKDWIDTFGFRPEDETVDFISQLLKEQLEEFIGDLDIVICKYETK